MNTLSLAHLVSISLSIKCKTLMALRLGWNGEEFKRVLTLEGVHFGNFLSRCYFEEAKQCDPKFKNYIFHNPK
jgi:hypothetical protein